MTDVLGLSVSDVARALIEARQSNSSKNAGASTQVAAVRTGRTGNEGDSVTLSEAAQEIVKIRYPDGTVGEGRLLTGNLKPITPQGLRGEAETAVQGILADLGIEGSLEFSIAVNDDGSIAVQSDDLQAAALEQAINADPALRKTMREMKLFSTHALEMPERKALMDWMREHENEMPPRSLLDAVEAVRERIEGSRYTVAMTDGTLTTTFADLEGEKFGGVNTETGLDGRWI